MDDRQQSEVDTTRPFGSVKEAVAVFGERLLLGDSYRRNTTTGSTTPSSRRVTAVALGEPDTTTIAPAPPKPSAFPTSPSLSSRSFTSINTHGKGAQEIQEATAIDHPLSAVVTRLESELEEMKREMMMVMERESEIEVVVASLNAELRRSTSRLTAIEAAHVAWKARQELSTEYEYLPSLSHLLSLGEIGDEFDSKKRTKKKRNRHPEFGMARKQKPIIPLIGDVFSYRKNKTPAETPTHHHSVYSPACSGVLS